MATINRFEEIKSWQKSRELSAEIYRITSVAPFSQDFALKNQIRRSAGSVMDNIAEGFERGGKKEFIQFLFIAKGSAGETRSQLYRAFDTGMISQEEFTTLTLKVEEISRMLMSFINYLKQTEIQGQKYK
ncbi:MAG: four helix bundle protein [Bacteroidia bacterium]